MARARSQVGGLARYLTWREIRPKVSDGEKPGWRDKQWRDNQVRLFISRKMSETAIYIYRPHCILIKLLAVNKKGHMNVIITNFKHRRDTSTNL